jgi:hypothetical protein
MLGETTVSIEVIVDGMWRNYLFTISIPEQPILYYLYKEGSGSENSDASIFGGLIQNIALNGKLPRDIFPLALSQDDLCW